MFQTGLKLLPGASSLHKKKEKKKEKSSLKSSKTIIFLQGPVSPLSLGALGLFLCVAFLVRLQGALAAEALPAGRAGEAADGVDAGHVGLQLLLAGEALLALFTGVSFPRSVLLFLVSAQLDEGGEHEVALGAGVLAGRGGIRFGLLLLLLVVLTLLLLGSLLIFSV